MTHSALVAKTASGGCATSVAAASLGKAALANARKPGGLLWRWDPALLTSILDQAGQRGLSAPMESTPPERRIGASESCEGAAHWCV
eukprot:358276-Chlamydomonas_euryale.AAC.1